jgi:hypothetical protein
MLDKTLLIAHPAETYDILALLPDFLPYDFQRAKNYHDYLNGINTHYRKLEGFDIKPVSRLRYYWESLKGWFGFSNQCESAKIQMASLKLVYWGYLNGYFSPTDLENIQKFLAPSPFATAVASEAIKSINSQSSGMIQSQLIQLFSMNQKEEVHTYLANNGLPRPRNYDFGAAYLRFNYLRKLIALDSNHSEIQEKIIQHGEFRACCEELPQYFKQKYALKLAHWVNDTLCEKPANTLWDWFVDKKQMVENKLLCAYALDESVAKKYLPLYIPLFIGKKNYTKAYDLIEAMDDCNAAMAILTKEFTTDEHLRAIKSNKNGDLIKQFAKYWMEKPLQQWKIVSLFSINGSSKQQCYHNAQRLVPSIELSYPSEFLEMYLNEQKMEEAYKLYCQASEQPIPHPFDGALVKALSKKLTEMGVTRLEQAKKAQADRNFELAEKCHRLSLETVQQVFRVAPEPENKTKVAQHYQHLAQCCFDKATVNNTLNLDGINDVLKLLEESRKRFPADRTDESFSLSLFTVLQKKVTLLHETLLLEKPHDSNALCLQWRKKCIPNVQELRMTIEELFVLASNVKPTVSAVTLGYLHFLKAELIDEFTSPGDYDAASKNAMSEYQQATQLCPNNPYYLKRYFLSVPTGSALEIPLLTQSNELLKKNNVSIDDYKEWNSARWLKSNALMAARSIAK